MKTVILPMALISIIMLSKLKVNAQANALSHSRTTGWYVGWDNSGTQGTLEIRNDFTSNNAIEFFNSGNTTPHVRVDANGNVSIGLTNATNYFGINSLAVLWHNGDPTSIFVGVGAGASTVASSTLYNTLLGNGAGYNLTTSSSVSGQKNCFMGYNAGYNATTHVSVPSWLETGEDLEPGNVAVGYKALYSNTTNVFSTAIGYKALYSYNPTTFTDFATNTAVGYKALYSTQAYGGCALGFMAGISNTYGCSLIAIGEKAAFQNLNGNDNTAIGEASLSGNKDLSGNVAIGHAALQSLSFAPESLLIADCSTCSDPDQKHGCVASYNVAVGNSSLFNTDATGLTGSSCSSYALTNGKQNTAIGILSGFNNKSGFNNTFLGFQADNDASHSGINNSTAIGANAIVLNDAQMILGNNDVQNVAIGYSGIAGYPAAWGNPTGYAKFNVLQSNGGRAGYSTAAEFDNQAQNTISIASYHSSNSAAGLNIGALGEIYKPNNSTVNQSNTAIWGLTVPNGQGESFVSVQGTTSQISGTSFNAAVMGDLGIAPCPTCSTSITNDFAGYFNGDVLCTTSLFVLSDSTLKDNIQNIANPMAILNALGRPKSYTFLQQQNMSMQLFRDSSSHYGLLAQAVERVMPGAVKSCVHPARRDSSGHITHAAIPFKAVNYTEFIAPLIGAAQTHDSTLTSHDSVLTVLKNQNQVLSQQNDSLASVISNHESRISQLENVVSQCCSQYEGHHSHDNGGNGDQGNTDGTNSGTVKLTIGDNTNAALLGQSIPNPSSNNVIIPFRIPQNCISASILITEVGTGKVVTAIPVSCKETHLEIEAGTIATGTYNYSLYVDGQLIDTKKMVLVK